MALVRCSMEVSYARRYWFFPVSQQASFKKFALESEDVFPFVFFNIMSRQVDSRRHAGPFHLHQGRPSAIGNFWGEMEQRHTFAIVVHSLFDDIREVSSKSDYIHEGFYLRQLDVLWMYPRGLNWWKMRSSLVQMVQGCLPDIVYLQVTGNDLDLRELVETIVCKYMFQARTREDNLAVRRVILSMALLRSNARTMSVSRYNQNLRQF